MALSSGSKVIRGDEYIVTQFKATKALRVLTELGRIVGPSLALLATDSKSGDPEDISQDVVSLALEALVQRADVDVVDRLIKTLAESTQVQIEGQNKRSKLPDVFDIHFAGADLPKLFEWLRFALEVHFADFFDYLVGSGQGVLKSVVTPDQKAG